MQTMHAGDLGTRKPRSRIAVLWWPNLIKQWSAVQSSVALSSGESERYALLRSLGMKATLNDLQSRSEMRDSHALR